MIDRINPQLANLVGTDKLLIDFPATTGSEDVQLLKGDNKNVQFAFIHVGTANPALVAKARAEGKTVSFSNYNPNCQVDLNAIPFGTKVASLMAIEFLQKSAFIGGKLERSFIPLMLILDFLQAWKNIGWAKKNVSSCILADNGHAKLCPSY
ncbi:hypothetical protein [Leptodesmis sp.]|uniref:hypothetical protein n=1 Tax=Leptodesmis sp. TaxID=3100501 RepID=UPI00405345C1